MLFSFAVKAGVGALFFGENVSLGWYVGATMILVGTLLVGMEEQSESSRSIKRRGTMDY